MELTLSFRVQSMADLTALSATLAAAVSKASGTDSAVSFPAEADAGPLRGEAAERQATAIAARVTAVETVAGLDDVLADAAQTLARLPDVSRCRVARVADAVRASLVDVPEPEDNASVLEVRFPVAWPVGVFDAAVPVRAAVGL